MEEKLVNIEMDNSKKIITPEMMHDMDIINGMKKRIPVMNMFGIEGLDSSGKDTCSRMIMAKMVSCGRRMLWGDESAPLIFKESFPRYNTVYGGKIKYLLHNVPQEDRDNIEMNKLYVLDRIDYFKSIINPVTMKGFESPVLVITDRSPIANMVCNLHTLSVSDQNKLLDATLTEIYTYGYNQIYLFTRLTPRGADKHNQYLSKDKDDRVVDFNESKEKQIQFSQNIRKLMKIKAFEELVTFIDIDDSAVNTEIIFADIVKRYKKS